MHALIQARMSSQRLPGKSLKKIAGRPILDWVVTHVASANLVSDVTVITSTEKSDDAIYEFCASSNVRCIRGPLQNVYERFSIALDTLNIPEFIRISADSPFISKNIINTAISEFSKGSFDLVTNTFPRSFPKGQSVEIVSSAAFKEMQKFKLSSDELEHVTSGFYTRSAVFRIKNFTHINDLSTTQMSVDSLPDLARARQAYSHFQRNDCNWLEVLHFFH